MADLTPLVSALSLRKLCGKDTVTYHGVYAGDLLSRAMSHVKAGSLWITIMNNMNVIAVASLTEADLPKGHKNLGKAMLDAALTYRKYTAGEEIAQPPSPFQRAGRSVAALFQRKSTT